jgi:precorrin-2 dehydrogenase/sirohydrochlorin ferrochelatase
MNKKWYPIMLQMHEQICFVVGGGQVATRKINGLIEVGAYVLVLSPDITEEIRALELEGHVKHIAAIYDPGILANWYSQYQKSIRLVFAATNNIKANEDIVNEARALGVFACSATDSIHADFLLPSVLRRGALTISVSTSGASPKLTQTIRDQIANEYGDEYEVWLQFLNDFRDYARVHIGDSMRRKQLFASILEEDMLTAIRNHTFKEKRNQIWRLFFATDYQD